MLRISAFPKQHMQLTNLAQTFAIAWGSILLVVGRGGFALNGEQSERLFILMYLVMLMYASLIAFWRILTPLALSGLTLVIYYLIFTAAMWIIIAVALMRPTFPRPQHG